MENTSPLLKNLLIVYKSVFGYWKGTALRNLSGEKGTILVVDDEASIRRILQTRLEMLDPEFIITARGSGYFFPRIIDSEQE